MDLGQCRIWLMCFPINTGNLLDWCKSGCSTISLPIVQLGNIAQHNTSSVPCGWNLFSVWGPICPGMYKVFQHICIYLLIYAQKHCYFCVCEHLLTRLVVMASLVWLSFLYHHLPLCAPCLQVALEQPFFSSPVILNYNAILRRD